MTPKIKALIEALIAACNDEDIVTPWRPIDNALGLDPYVSKYSDTATALLPTPDDERNAMMSATIDDHLLGVINAAHDGYMAEASERLHAALTMLGLDSAYVIDVRPIPTQDPDSPPPADPKLQALASAELHEQLRAAEDLVAGSIVIMADLTRKLDKARRVLLTIADLLIADADSPCRDVVFPGLDEAVGEQAGAGWYATAEALRKLSVLP